MRSRTPRICITSSSLFCLSSSPLGRGMPIDVMPILSTKDASKLAMKAAADGLSKFIGAAPGWLLLPIRMPVVAGDFLICCGDDLGP